MKKSDELSTLQKKFVTYFLKTMNPTKSAINAGYSKSGAKKTAEYLLSNPVIIAEINSRLKAQASSLRVEKLYVVKKLLDIIEFSLSEEDILDKDGNKTGKTKLRDTSAGLRALESLTKYLSLGASDSAPDDSPSFIENINLKKI